MITRQNECSYKNCECCQIGMENNMVGSGTAFSVDHAQEYV